jgi:hypothetical protein
MDKIKVLESNFHALLDILKIYPEYVGTEYFENIDNSLSEMVQIISITEQLKTCSGSDMDEINSFSEMLKSLEVNSI